MPLKIESIETIPIRVPLPFTYKGSYYKMRNRCTIITRIRTSGGHRRRGLRRATRTSRSIEIRRSCTTSSLPLVIGLDAFATERCLEAMLPVDLRPACATALVCDAGDGVHRHGRLGRRRQGPRAAAVADSGAATATGSR